MREFFVVEGGEGSGKTTAIASALEILRESGHRAISFREPGSSPLGESVKALLYGQQNSAFELAMAMNWQRSLLLRGSVKAALEDGQIVLVDRHVLSTLVHQAEIGGVDHGVILDIHGELLRSAGLSSAHTYLIDVPWDVRQERLLARGNLSPMDHIDEEGLRREHDAFVRCAPLVKAEMIDGARSVNEVARDLVERVLVRVHERTPKRVLAQRV